MRAIRPDGLVARLGLDEPIVLAPMAGPCTPELVAAVSDAGGLGSLAAGYLPPDRLAAELEAVRRMTTGPFAVNVFAPDEPAGDGGGPAPPGTGDGPALEALARLRAEVGLPEEAEPGGSLPGLDDQLAVLLEDPPAVVSFTFGIPPARFLDPLRRRGVLLVGTATTVAEARALAAAGVDAVCAQGAEAGAHRGSFLGDARRSLIGTVALVPQVVDAVGVPVLAAGGIGDGRGVAAAIVLGADAAQVGTAFLRCPEAATPPAHRQALATAAAEDTTVTAGLTGRAARGVRNRLVDALDGVAVPPYPRMHLLTAGLRREAAARGRSDLMALWAGQAAALGREEPAADVVRRLAAGARRLLGDLGPG